MVAGPWALALSRTFWCSAWNSASLMRLSFFSFSSFSSSVRRSKIVAAGWVLAGVPGAALGASGRSAERPAFSSSRVPTASTLPSTKRTNLERLLILMAP